jgi:hypothetical protein
MMTAAAFRKLRLLLEVAQNTASEKILAKRPQERMGDSISLVILNGGEAGVRDLTNRRDLQRRGREKSLTAGRAAVPVVCCDGFYGS